MAARVVVALTTLWILLSRPALPSIVTWPAPFWRHPDAFLRTRFLMPPLPAAIEWTLFAILLACLVAVAIGRMTRVAAFLAAVLLYHFAPFEDIFSASGGPFFRGLTVPVTALFVLSFASAPRRNDEPSPEWRWPLKLIQLLFAFTYFLSGIVKLRIVGPSWATPANFEGLVLGLVSPDVAPPWAHHFIGNPVLCTIGAIVALLFDFGFVLGVFSRRAARVTVPAALLTHIAIVGVFGVVFPATPLLLLFVNWD